MLLGSVRSGFGRALPRPMLLVAAALVIHSSPLAAQNPPPTRTDTLAQDSAKVIADSVKPPAIIAKHATGSAPSFGAAVWEWSREQLLLEGALTLTDLLQQIPGLTPYRAGLALQPEIASIFGHTRGRLQIVLDGYELDPLLEATTDLTRIELAELERVRVERRLDVTRIELTTIEPTDGRPHSRIEAGVGEPDTNMFRGVFLAPRFLIGPFGFAIERVDTDGFRGGEPADVFSGWAKFAWIRGASGIQAEYRQNGLQRSPRSPWVADGSRRDLILRARAALSDGLVAEVFGGRSAFENDTSTVAPADDAPIVKPEATVFQLGGRASFTRQAFWADASARFRDHDALPSLQIDGQAGLQLGQVAAVQGSVTHAAWRAAGSAASYDVRAQTASVGGLHAFAELAGGKRGAPSAVFGSADSAFLGELSALRVGAGLQRWGGSVSAAFVALTSDSAQSFGLPFDTTDLRFRGGDLKGWEITWQVPLFLRGLSATGYYMNWPSGNAPIYMPGQQWRVALQLHDSPLRSGNLELYGRIELRHRGNVMAPIRAGTPASWDVTILPGYDQVDAYVQIRILDVRIFFRTDNMTNQEVFELPGRTILGQRIFYGIKWQFWN